MLKIGCLGPEASFSFQAAKNLFPDDEIIICNSITSVFDLIEQNEIDNGVVPIENSTGGSVSITLDELISKNLFINSEYFLKIKHSLLSNYKLSDVTQIFSHPQAFAQCKNWLKSNAKNKELIESSSTSRAVEKASKVDFSAAIGSMLAGEKYGVGIIEQEINDSGKNETRFVIVSKKPLDPKGKEKTSLIFGAKNQPGSLFNILEAFKNESINLTKLESRPATIREWEYLFFVDFQGNLSQKNVLKAIQNIAKNSVEIKVLGSYSKIKE
jgi:chorismate mutase / prephenate dehydratase